ncbi:methylmalonyl Co-A mutase-associated GTPase MeaB [Flexibacterium corallicola]|uniref:methylmalonyl Co-A mutase-associated GTPase MeaB n=1 Tax=Flexibacterium corallicola TaxID=3037259 RepID=UPI00286F6ECC|nr:methylmalonyl Co-A mutase-associated GTPase MeaB [Pseudovibrio sp. M1P-2-3]
MKATNPKPPMDLKELATLIIEGNRSALARAITLVESKNPHHRKQAEELLSLLMGNSGKALRIGITGVPGVGKSTTIDSFGSNLTAAGYKIAVLAVDPSSTRKGGSILGDKTRMSQLAHDKNAYIRPSPSSGTLGGVAAKTRETMLLCEAAGFDIILVETVGIGQSEITVAQMVDLFLVLMLPGAGDELQGIKKGVLEVADLIAINKADGEGDVRARKAASEYRAALNILAPRSKNWSPPVLTISGLNNLRLNELWSEILRFQETMKATGEWDQRRSEQQVAWMWSLLQDNLISTFKENQNVRDLLPNLEESVRHGHVPASAAASQLTDVFFRQIANTAI